MLDTTRKNEPDQAAIDTVNLSRIRAEQESHASATGSLRSIFAKCELQGLHLGAPKRALKAKKSDKIDEMIEEYVKTLEYLRLMGVEVDDPQIEMFAAKGPMPEDERAENKGRSAGMLGEKESDNPYDAASKFGRSWIKGFRDGEAQRKLVLSMPEPKVEASAEAEDDAED